ncbi:uncharacterized protein LOC119085211 [Bradysia coprophila]|uniref:uncharacterized protein LOC119085211 n=1 Tax=Bradysia coprophila TaxID=38358 RepID=UPI00187DC520|nr:uncharacterized protein LOC119085211 [Bradysia coprophila]
MPSPLSTVDQTNVNAALPIELTNTTGTYLHHMNEDCLLQIFSSDSLTPTDLCSLAETCTRFQQITQRVFPKGFSIERNHYCCDHSYMDEDRCQYRFKSGTQSICYENAEDVERILKNFGPHLSTLLISCDETVANLVAKYCDDISLNDLRIEDIRSIECLSVKLKPIFQRLLTLVIVGCHLVIDATTLELNCDSLIELIIVSSTGCGAILSNTFPNLDRFTFRHSDVYSANESSDLLSAFIGRHRRLRALKVSVASCTSDLLHTIGKSCNELENLNFKGWNYNGFSYFSDFSGLAKLKKLTVTFSSLEYSLNIALLQAPKLLETVKVCCMCEGQVQVFDILSKMGNLRALHLNCCRFDQSAIPWKMLKQLRKLSFADCSNFYHTELFNVLRELPNLEELKFYYFVLKAAEFAKIVKMLEGRSNVLTLRCMFDISCLKYCTENRNVKLINLGAP